MEPKVTDRADAVSKAGASKLTREVNNERLKDFKSASRFIFQYSIFNSEALLRAEGWERLSMRPTATTKALLGLGFEPQRNHFS